MNNIVTKLPITYKQAVDIGLQGTISEVSYSVKNYINPSRKLVTNQKINSNEVGRETIEGEEIHKKCNVYLPAGYDKKEIDTKYKVLYLLHGVGGDRGEWLSGNGKTDGNYNICNIFDNLIANGEIEPLIIVFPEGRSAYDWTDCSFHTEGTNMLGFYYFDYELRYDLIPFIESEYNTFANIKAQTPEAIDYNRQHRAIAGLSMGGMQSLNLTLGGYRCDSTSCTGTISPWKNGLDTTVPTPGMLDMFSYVGAFSNAPTSSGGKQLGAGIESSGYKLSLLYITCGDADGVAYQAGYEKAVDQLSEAAGDKLGDYYGVLIKNGLHDFDVWNNGAYNFVRLAFGRVNNNPIIWADIPDPDVIRVEDTYYMISTTMHFMPGGVIFRSYDLIHWEIATYVYDSLDNTPGQRLVGELSIYGKGMWAASLRYQKGTFYVCFVANDTGKTYLYQSENILGPWRKENIEGFYHDCSLLFEDDGRVYIVYGNKEIWLTELNSDLTAPKPGGLNRLVVKDTGNVILGYEGAHLYKINDKYYLFFIHWPADGLCLRTEACFVADSLEGEFVGKNVLEDDMGYHNSGVAQGGIVDTPEGEWYAILFQDHGAVGRIPVLVPVQWKNGFPVFGIDGKVPREIEIKSTRPDYRYEPLVDSDDFNYVPDEKGKVHLKKVWQWNHTPAEELWSVTDNPGTLRIRSGKLSPNVGLAVNTLTQRMVGPVCEAIVTVDGEVLSDGDYAGITSLQGCYGLIALTKEDGKYYLSMIGKELNKDESIWGEKGGDRKPGQEYSRIPVTGARLTLKVQANFEDNIDEADFFYLDNKEWIKLGVTQKLYFRLDHFVGCRVGLFMYSTKEIGGSASFSNFIYNSLQERK